MNAPTPINRAARDLEHLAALEDAAKALNVLLVTLRRTGGKYNTRAEWDLLDVLETAEVALGVDATESLDCLRSELRINEEGYRLNDDGDRTEFRVHVPAPERARRAAA